MQSGKDLSVNSIDHVLNQDNAVKNPITELSIAVGTPDDSSVAILNFYRKHSEIAIHVTSPNIKWASEIFSEIEEQVERTLVHSWVYTVRRTKETRFLFATVLAALMGMVTVLATVFSSAPSVELSRRLLLSPQDVQRLQTTAQASQSTEQRVAFLFEFHTAQLKTLASLGNTTSPLHWLSRLRWPILLVALPFAIILVAAWYLFARCYPGSVFAWGDYADHLKVLIERRRFLWTTIVTALVIGVVGNLAVYGLSQFLRP